MARGHRYWLILVALIVAVGIVWVPPVSAHARLKTSMPAPNAMLSQAPTQIVLTFTEETSATMSNGRVLDMSGAAVSTGFVVDLNDRTKMTIALRPGLGAGMYTVKYHTFTENDSGVVDDMFTFTVAQAGGASTPARAMTTATAAASASPAATNASATIGANAPVTSPTTAPTTNAATAASTMTGTATVSSEADATVAPTTTPAATPATMATVTAPTSTATVPPTTVLATTAPQTPTSTAIAVVATTSTTIVSTATGAVVTATPMVVTATLVVITATATPLVVTATPTPTTTTATTGNSGLPIVIWVLIGLVVLAVVAFIIRSSQVWRRS